jgi:cyclic pyranopterin phosphate synthase
MCKSVDRSMTVGEVRLLKKTGGKSGTYVRSERATRGRTRSK